MKLRVKLFFFGIVLLSSCDKNNLEKEMISCQLPVTYSQTVQPLIQTRCALTGCHTAGSTTGNFDTYEELRQRVDNGKLKLSVFDLKIMPPDVPLSDEELQKIKCWMEQGALP
jgi:hypothetical protein